jgi:hypothetical protein
VMMRSPRDHRDQPGTRGGEAIVVACVGAEANADNLSRGRTLAPEPKAPALAPCYARPCGNVGEERSERGADWRPWTSGQDAVLF